MTKQHKMVRVKVQGQTTIHKFFVDTTHKCSIDDKAGHFHLYWGYLADADLGEDK